MANLLNFAFASTPAADQQTSGGVPSNPYAMAAAPDGQTLYVTDGASGSVLKVLPDGTIRLFAALPKMPPLTGLAFGPDGRLYVAMLSALPAARDTGAIWVADSTGRLRLAAGAHGTRLAMPPVPPMDAQFSCLSGCSAGDQASASN